MFHLSPHIPAMARAPYTATLVCANTHTQYHKYKEE